MPEDQREVCEDLAERVVTEELGGQRRTEAAMVGDVRNLRAVWSVLLVLLWTPAAVHCRLEALPGLAFLACGDAASQQPHPDDPCDADGCAVVESGFYKVEDDPLQPMPSLLGSGDFLPEVPWTDLKRPVLSRPTGLAPPELGSAWQVFNRAVALARAPSSLL